MALQVLGHVVSFASGGNPVTEDITLPVGIQAGDLLVWLGVTGGSTYDFSSVGTFPFQNARNGSGGFAQFRICDGSEGGVTITLTTERYGRHRGAMVWLRGAENPWAYNWNDVLASIGQGSTVPMSDITVDNDGSVILRCVNRADNYGMSGTWTVSGMNNTQIDAGSNQGWFFYEEDVDAGTHSVSMTGGGPTNRTLKDIGLALKAADTMNPVPYVVTSTSTIGTKTAWNISKSTYLQDNDLGIAILNLNDVSLSSVPSGWLSLGNHTSNPRCYIYYKYFTDIDSEPSTFDFTFPSENMAGVYFALRGAANPADRPIDFSGFSLGTSTQSHAAQGITTTYDNSLVCFGSNTEFDWNNDIEHPDQPWMIRNRLQWNNASVGVLAAFQGAAGVVASPGNFGQDSAQSMTTFTFAVPPLEEVGGGPVETFPQQNLILT